MDNYHFSNMYGIGDHVLYQGQEVRIIDVVERYRSQSSYFNYVLSNGVSATETQIIFLHKHGK